MCIRDRPFTDEEVKSEYRVALMYMIEEAKEILKNTKSGISSISRCV